MAGNLRETGLICSMAGTEEPAGQAGFVPWDLKREWKAFLMEEDGMGVVEVILIIVVLISLVAIFKSQISSLVNTVLEKVTKNAKKI